MTLEADDVTRGAASVVPFQGSADCGISLGVVVEMTQHHQFLGNELLLARQRRDLVVDLQ